MLILAVEKKVDSGRKGDHIRICTRERVTLFSEVCNSLQKAPGPGPC
jgi:hypothetical protein